MTEADNWVSLRSTLRERAELARLDFQEEQELDRQRQVAECIEIAYEILPERLGLYPDELDEIEFNEWAYQKASDHLKQIYGVSFEIEGMRFRLRMMNRNGTEEPYLEYVRRASNHEIKHLADLGKLL